MPRILRSYSVAEDYELHERERVKEPELRRRLEDPNNSRYIFVSRLRGEEGIIAKYCQVEGVQPKIGRNGLFIVQFGVQAPAPGRTRAGSVAYFEDGLYKEEVKDGKTLQLSDGEITDAEVVSGFFVPRPTAEADNDALMVEVMEARLRGDDYLI